MPERQDFDLEAYYNFHLDVMPCVYEQIEGIKLEKKKPKKPRGY